MAKSGKLVRNEDICFNDGLVLFNEALKCTSKDNGDNRIRRVYEG